MLHAQHHARSDRLTAKTAGGVFMSSQLETMQVTGRAGR